MSWLHTHLPEDISHAVGLPHCASTARLFFFVPHREVLTTERIEPLKQVEHNSKAEEGAAYSVTPSIHIVSHGIADGAELQPRVGLGAEDDPVKGVQPGAELEEDDADAPVLKVLRGDELARDEAREEMGEGDHVGGDEVEHLGTKGGILGHNFLSLKIFGFKMSMQLFQGL